MVLEAAFATVPFAVITLKAVTTISALANVDFRTNFISIPHLPLSYRLLLTRESLHCKLSNIQFVLGLTPL